jgi:hypothetical protein
LNVYFVLLDLIQMTIGVIGSLSFIKTPEAHLVFLQILYDRYE